MSPMSFSDRPVVLVLFGGQSSEHEISCATAAGVLEAIDQTRWEVIPVGITRDGHWVPQPNDPARYRLGETGGYEVLSQGEQVSFLSGTTSDGHPRLVYFQVDEEGRPLAESLHPGPVVDVVFPLLHGPFGEDGTLQGLLELSGVRYVGCGVSASAVAMDKRLTKTVLEDAGIPVGRWEGVSARQWQADREGVLARLDRLGLPVFVKPCRAGSSLGITRVTDAGELAAAIEAAHEHDPQVIVEAAHAGREIECGILQLPGGELVASPLGEITVTDAQFYDYESKYFGQGGVQLSCPAQVNHAAAIQEAARVSFEALGAEGLARVDFFYQEETGSYIVNEVNTLPGFTPYSMYPTMLAQAGYPYPKLVATLLEEAMSRPVGLR